MARFKKTRADFLRHGFDGEPFVLNYMTTEGQVGPHPVNVWMYLKNEECPFDEDAQFIRQVMRRNFDQAERIDDHHIDEAYSVVDEGEEIENIGKDSGQNEGGGEYREDQGREHQDEDNEEDLGGEEHEERDLGEAVHQELRDDAGEAVVIVSEHNSFDEEKQEEELDKDDSQNQEPNEADPIK